MEMKNFDLYQKSKYDLSNDHINYMNNIYLHVVKKEIDKYGGQITISNISDTFAAEITIPANKQTQNNNFSNENKIETINPDDHFKSNISNSYYRKLLNNRFTNIFPKLSSAILHSLKKFLH